MFIVAFGNLCNTVDLQVPFMDKYVNKKSNNNQYQSMQAMIDTMFVNEKISE